MSKGTEFWCSAIALLVFVAGALTLIGSEQYMEDRNNHRNMQEGKSNGTDN